MDDHRYEELTERINELDACIRAYRQIFAIAMRDLDGFSRVIDAARNQPSTGIGTPLDHEFARIHQQLDKIR